MCSRGHWRPHEDEKLRELVAKYGPHNWNAIAENLQGRSGTHEHLRLIVVYILRFFKRQRIKKELKLCQPLESYEGQSPFIFFLKLLLCTSLSVTECFINREMFW